LCGAARFNNNISDLSGEPGIANKRGIEIFLLSGIVIVPNPDEFVVLERFQYPVDGGPTVGVSTCCARAESSNPLARRNERAASNFGHEAGILIAKLRSDFARRACGAAGTSQASIPANKGFSRNTLPIVADPAAKHSTKAFKSGSE
jgi:hypothetical protein